MGGVEWVAGYAAVLRPSCSCKVAAPTLVPNASQVAHAVLSRHSIAKVDEKAQVSGTCTASCVAHLCGHLCRESERTGGQAAWGSSTIPPWRMRPGLVCGWGALA